MDNDLMVVFDRILVNQEVIMRNLSIFDEIQKCEKDLIMTAIDSSEDVRQRLIEERL